MTVKERILAIRLSERLNHHPNFINNLGISVSKQPEETLADKSSEKATKPSIQQNVLYLS